jgi:hypothetical protein
MGWIQILCSLLNFCKCCFNINSLSTLALFTTIITWLLLHIAGWILQMCEIKYSEKFFEYTVSDIYLRRGMVKKNLYD